MKIAHCSDLHHHGKVNKNVSNPRGYVLEEISKDFKIKVIEV